MKPTFLNQEKPILTVMLKHSQTPDTYIEEIRRALSAGAEAFGLQAECLARHFHTEENFRRIFAEMQEKPLYITNYKLGANENLSYDALADELLSYAEWGATLCDVMGDMFDKHPEELTQDAQAIEKQMQLIERLHEKGAEVMMSSHVNQFISAEKVLEIALEHQRRGADISKIVTHANSMEQQIENLRITNLLKEKLDIPFLYLSGGECRLHRRVGILAGCCMSLCVCELPPGSKNPQPLIEDQRRIRDSMGF